MDVTTAMQDSRTLLCATVVLTLASVIVAGQAQPALRTACVFPIADLSPQEVAAAKGTSVEASGSRAEDAERAQSLSSVISAEIGRAGFLLVPESRWRATAEGSNLSGRDFLDPAKAAAAARAAGASMAVCGFYFLQGDRILLSVSFYDVGEGDLMAGFMKTWRYNLGIYSSLHNEIHEQLARLGPAQARETRAFQKAIAPVPLLAAVTFTSPQDGMEVLLPGGRSIGRIEGGKLVFSAPGTRTGETLLVEKRLAGYHTGWQRVHSAPLVVLSPLARTARVAVETAWTAGQLIGAGGAIRYYTAPDFLFFSFSLYPYGQSPVSQWGNWLLHVDSEISVGSYLFFPPDSLFRLGASAGVGLIVSLAPAGAPDLPTYTDAYLNLPSVWAELNLPGVSFFLRPEIKLSLGITAPNLLGRNIILAGSTFPPVTLGALLKW
jgi:hypothetical protein